MKVFIAALGFFLTAQAIAQPRVVADCTITKAMTAAPIL